MFLRLRERIVAVITAAALLLHPFAAMAGGTVVTITPSTGTTGANTARVRWQASGMYVTGTVIQLDVSPSVSAFDILNASTTSIGNGGIATYTSTSTNQLLLTVTTAPTSTAASSTLYLPFTLSSSAVNYGFSILTSSSTSSTVPVDFGSALFYANGGNQVTVSASVPASLTFSIRTVDDTADTNTCSLGSLSTSLTALCEYRLRLATNANGGLQVRVQANHDFANAAQTATFTNIGENASFGINAEAYGYSLVQAATTGVRDANGDFINGFAEASSTPGFDFSQDATPVPTSTSALFIYAPAAVSPGAAPSPTDLSRIRHSASISGGTPAGNYSQIVTYTVTSSF
jgi:hypothetical protein